MTRGALSGSNHRKDPSFTPTSRPNSSLVKVDSIFINIVAAEQIKPKKCEHFTIRGFVSDSREQNGKPNWPFSVEGDYAGSEETSSTLYPLHTPQFKSWRCQSCLNEINAAAAVAAKKDGHNIIVKCSRQLKAKSFRSHRSLESVVTYLSEKLKEPQALGWTLCEGIESAPEFKQKHKHKQNQKEKHKQKQTLDSALHSNTRGLGVEYMYNAANGFTSNQQDSLAFVDDHQKESLRLPITPSSTKLVIDGSQHEGRHAEATKLVLRQYDDLVGTGCRKTKAKKVRLLNEILEKDGKGARPVMSKGFHSDESANAICSGSQSLQKVQLDNVRCQIAQKRNNNCQEQDRKWSQMHYPNSADGNDERRNAQGINSVYANALHVTSNDGRSDAVIEQADKIVFRREQIADGHTNYPDGRQKTSTDSCGRQEQLSTCQPFHGRATDSLHNYSPRSHIKRKSKDTVPKVHRGANFLPPSDNGKGLEGKNATPKLMGTIRIGNLTQYSQPIQDGNSSRRHYSFYDGCLDPRKSTGHWIPGTGNTILSNDTAVYVGESSSACKSLVDKIIHQCTNSTPALKRPNQEPCGGNKKLKHGGRTEGGPTIVHRTELLLGNSSKMSVMLGNPESRGNMRQEVGTIDDIPMEIVELMAKNQYERHLPEVADNHYVQQSGSSSKNDLVGSTHMPTNDVPQGQLHEKPHLPNVHVISEENLGISNGKSNVHKMQRPPDSIRRLLLSSQPELSGVLQFPAVGSGQSIKYDMNKAASDKRVPPGSQAQFELWQPTSQQSDKTDRAWPTVPHNNQVHKPCFIQGNALQSFNVGKVPKCGSYVGEGQDFGNVAPIGKKTHNFRPEGSGTLCPNRVDSRLQMMGSPDPYANEAIPAMHLLSLMNDRPQSSTPATMDAIVNRRTFESSFTNDHLAKELSGNSLSVGKSSHKLKQPSPFGYHKNPQSDVSCLCSPPIPAFSSGVESLHGDIGDKRGVQPSSYHQERAFLNVNPGSSVLPKENKSIKYQKSPLTNTAGVAFQQLLPAHELANHIFGPSLSVPGSSDLHINGNFYRYRNAVAHEPYDTFNKRAEPSVCYVNRNPMEFTTPGPGNEYMIGPEELKLRKMYPPPYTGPMGTNSFKQLGFIKYTVPNNRL